MESSVQDLDEPCRKKLSVTIDGDRVERQFEKSFRELRNTVALPGFRRGKAPRSLLERRFGAAVADDVKRDLVIEALEEAIKSNELEVVADPEFDFEGIAFERGKALTFDAVVEVRPNFELPDYKGIEVERKVAAVTDQNVENVLDDLRRQRAVMAPADEDAKVAKDDHVIGRFEVLDGDEVIFERASDGAIAGDAESLAQIPMPGLGAELLGKSRGDAIEIETRVPDEYPVQDMRSRDVRCRFEIKEIKRLEMPEIDEEFAKLHGFDDLASFRARIREDLATHHEHQADHAVEEAIVDELLKRVDFPLPPSTVARALSARVRELAMRALMNGTVARESLEGHVKQLEEAERPEVERGIRSWYLLQKIAKKERVFATESDLDARIEQIALQENMTPTQVREQLTKNDSLDDLRTSILESKVKSILVEHAKVGGDLRGAAKEAGEQGGESDG